METGQPQSQPLKTSQTKKIVAAIIIASAVGALLGFGLSYVVLDSKINALGMNELGTPKKWVLIGSYDGVGDRDISSFTVNVDLWKVYWYAKTDTKDYAAFALGFKSQDNRLVYYAVALPDDFTVPTAMGVNYAVGKGEYSITVNVANLNSWGFTVYAYQ